MNKSNEWMDQDQELLEAIAELAAEGDDEKRQVDSLYHFSVLLADARPVADESFRRQLEGRLITHFIAKREAQKMNVEQSKQAPLAWTFPVRPRWRLALSGLAVLALLLIGLLAFSMPARAYAQELFNWVTGQVSQTKVLVFEDGVLVEERVITTEETEPITFDEAQAQVNFSIRLPEYLPVGYSVREFDTFFAPEALVIRFDRVGGPQVGIESFELHESIQPEIYTGGEPIGEVVVDGKVMMWIKDISTTYDEAGNPSPLIAQKLYWEDDGVYFTLRSYDLSQEEIARIAGSIE